MSLGDEIRGKMPLIIDPIDTAGIPDRPSGITSVRKGTTGLDIPILKISCWTTWRNLILGYMSKTIMIVKIEPFGVWLISVAIFLAVL